MKAWLANQFYWPLEEDVAVVAYVFIVAFVILSNFCALLAYFGSETTFWLGIWAGMTATLLVLFLYVWFVFTKLW